jgi:hypothetical protein
VATRVMGIALLPLTFLTFFLLPLGLPFQALLF